MRKFRLNATLFGLLIFALFFFASNKSYMFRFANLFAKFRVKPIKPVRISSTFEASFKATTPISNYLAILPFLVISQQQYLKSECFFTSSGPKRNKMENRVAVVQYQANNPIEDTYSCEQVSTLDGYFISVFDGHGGWQLSNYARDNLAFLFKSALKANTSTTGLQSNEEIIMKSIKDSYQALEKNYYDIVLKSYQLGFHQVSRVGSCALSAFVHENKLYIANLGDCKAILIKSERSTATSQKLTHKFNANSKKEQAKLKEQFPDDKEIFVCRKGSNSACYVKNSLQPTRAFGDFRLKYSEFNNPQNKEIEYGYPRKIHDFKGPYISADPEIKVHELQPNDRFLIMGSDGLWDELNHKEIEKIVQENLKETKNVIAEKIFNAAFEKAAKSNRMNTQELRKVPVGSVRRKMHDDITLIVVDLKNQGK